MDITRSETNFTDLSDYMLAVSKEIDKLFKEGLEKCGYDMEWFKANTDRFSAVNENQLTELVFLDHKPIFKIIFELKNHVNSEQNSYEYEFRVHLEIIEEGVKNESE